MKLLTHMNMWKYQFVENTELDRLYWKFHFNDEKTRALLHKFFQQLVVCCKDK